jgi:phage gp46-like protein
MINLYYENDLDKQSFGLCDISFTRGNTLTSAVLMSIFSWRRGAKEEVDDELLRYGWWADASNSRKLGSKLWLLRRVSITPAIMQRAKEYIEEALQWMIDDGICKTITATVQRTSKMPDAIQVRIVIYKNDGTQQIETFDQLWRELE